MLKITFIIILILFLTNLIWSFQERLQHGATLNELIKTKFYEIFPLRATLWLGFSLLSLRLFQICGISLSSFYDVFTQNNDFFTRIGSLISAIIWTIATISLGILLWFIYQNLLIISEQNQSDIKTRGVKISSGINPDLLQTLGAEKFPNQISPTRHSEKVIRKRIAIGGSASLILSLFLLFKNQDYQLGIDFSSPLLPILSQDLSLIKIIGLIILLTVFTIILFLVFKRRDYTFFTFPPNKTSKLLVWSGLIIALFFLSASLIKIIGLISLLTIPSGILLLLFNNRDYTFFTFRQSLIMESLLGCSLIITLIFLGYNFATICTAALLLLTFYGFRALADLHLDFHYQKIKQIYNPISEKIQAHLPYLEEIVEDSQLRLGSLDQEQLVARISQGCKNFAVNVNTLACNSSPGRSDTGQTRVVSSYSRGQIVYINRNLGNNGLFYDPNNRAWFYTTRGCWVRAGYAYLSPVYY